jgi:hypothetical protein
MSRRNVGLGLVPLLVVLLGGCASNPPVSTPPNSSEPSSAPSQGSSPTPTPLLGYSVTLATCCRATLPTHWTAPQVVDNTVVGSYDATGKLYVTWQVVGPAHKCPTEPPALLDSLTSPSHPTGDVITAVDPLRVNGQHVTAYISAPSTATPRHYQYINADVVVGASCIDLGGAEYGVASTANLETLLQILATTKSLSSPAQPSTP